MLLCLILLGSSLLMVFRNWISIDDPALRSAILEEYRSGNGTKSTAEILADQCLKSSAVGQDSAAGGSGEGGNASTENGSGSEEDGTGSGSDGSGSVEAVLSFTPEQTFRMTADLSAALDKAAGTAAESAAAGGSLEAEALDKAVSDLHTASQLMQIWFYAILASAALALLSVFTGRVSGTIPYPVMVCTYLWFLSQVAFKSVDALVGNIRVFSLTTFAWMSAGLALLLLLVSILLREQK